MAQPQQQNFQQTDNYYDPTAGYENTTADTGSPYPPADAVGYPPADAVNGSSTGYVPGEYGAEFSETTVVPDGTQTQEAGEANTETGVLGTEIPPEAGDVTPEEQDDPGENPADADVASVSGAGTGQTPVSELPPVEAGDGEVQEGSPPNIEAKEGTDKKSGRNSKSQNYSSKYGGRSGSRRLRQSGSGDYYKSTYNSKSSPTTTTPSAMPYPYAQQQPYQSPCQIGVIPMRSAAFQAPRIPLPKLCKNLLPDEADEGQEDEDGVAFQFKPQTHCRTEVTFTIEPKPQPPWLTMLNCGFKPMVNCSAPPCYLSPSGNPGMDYMGGTQTVVNRAFGTQVQYSGMANFPTLQQIQNSFPGGKIIDATRKDTKGKAVSKSGSSSESSSSEDSSSSESEEEYHHHQHYQHGHPYHHGVHQTHYHQAPAHHQYPQHHPQHPHHPQYAHHVQQHQPAQVQKHQHPKQEVEPPRRRSTHRKSRFPSSEDLPKKSAFTARRTLRQSNVHDHDHKHRHSRHSRHSQHHSHVAESSESDLPVGSDLSRSSDWHL